MEALRQAVREPLAQLPRDHKGFAMYIFDRARELDHQWALAKKVAEQKASLVERVVTLERGQGDASG